MARKVNLFIVGAAKCGTTSLYHYLSQHPSFYTTRPKEPRYFASDIPEQHRLVKTMDEYRKIYEGAPSNAAYLVDASPAYMYSHRAAREIYDYNRDAKIVVMLRPPADLLYSVHAQYLWSCDENINDFSEAWSYSQERKMGRKIPKGCRNPMILVYTEFAMLGLQMERYFEIFPREQIHVILFEDLKKDSAQCFGRLLDFLQILTVEDIDFSPQNVNTVHRSRLLSLFVQGKFTGKKQLKKISSALGLDFSPKLRAFLAKVNDVRKKRPPMPQETRTEIEMHYERDVRKIERLLGIELEGWRSSLPDRQESRPGQVHSGKS